MALREIKIYPAQQLGNITELLEGLSMGTIDMVCGGEAFVEMFEKDIAFFQIPFLWTKEEIESSSYLRVLRERIRAKKNIRTLPGFGYKPSFHLWTQKRIVRTPDELNGIKVRLWQQKAMLDMWNGLGASATPLPWGDVYMALAQGVVNGMPHNVVQVHEEKFFEHLDYCTFLNFMPNVNVYWINDGLYKRFPKELQEIFDEAALEGCKWFNEYCTSMESKAQSAMEKKGIKFIKTDRTPWVEKAKKIHVKLEQEGCWSKGLLEKKANGNI